MECERRGDASDGVVVGGGRVAAERGAAGERVGTVRAGEEAEAATGGVAGDCDVVVEGIEDVERDGVREGGDDVVVLEYVREGVDRDVARTRDVLRSNLSDILSMLSLW